MSRQDLRVLVVDDEPPARARLVDLLAAQDGIARVDEADDGVTAVRSILESAPDLVFLDVQMPDLDGFGVLEALPAEHHPEIVFVTAFDRYALAAFDAAAIDYLLKPYSDERFAEAMSKARRALAAPKDESLQNLVRSLPTEGRLPLRRIPVQDRERILFVDVAEIQWLEAEDVYVRLHLAEESRLLRSPLGALLERLEPGRFVRVHRSAAVAIDHLVAVHPLFRGAHELELRCGARVRSSRGYRDAVQSLVQWRG